MGRVSSALKVGHVTHLFDDNDYTNREIVDSTLCPQWQLTMSTWCMVFIVLQNLVGISAVLLYRHSPLELRMHMTRHRPLCEKNDAWSHNLSQHRQKRSKLSITVYVCLAPFAVYYCSFSNISTREEVWRQVLSQDVLRYGFSCLSHGTASTIVSSCVSCFESVSGFHF